MLTRTFQTMAGLTVAATLLLVGWPQLFGLERAALLAQAVSLRGSVALLAVFGIVLLAALTLFLPRIRRFIASVAVLLFVFVVASAIVLISRGFGSTPVGHGSTITVLSWNTMGDAPGAERIAELALQNGADIVALPETTAETANRVARIMAAKGHPMTARTLARDEVSKARSTSLLISAALGEYSIERNLGNTNVLPSVIATPVNREGPTIIAVHAVSPVQGQMDNWRADLSWLGNQCRRGNIIMAGDFNATLDHLDALGEDTFDNCTDAALATRSAAVGTWPTLVSPVLGSPIDHVMFSDEWHVTGMRVVTGEDSDAGSDHRPILAWLGPVPGAPSVPVTPNKQ